MFVLFVAYIIFVFAGCQYKMTKHFADKINPWLRSTVMLGQIVS